MAEKTKEQASHLGGAVFSGAGNIAAATGLVKKEEFPTDMKVSGPPPHVRANTHTYTSHITHAYQTHSPPLYLQPTWGTREVGMAVVAVTGTQI